MMTYLSLLGALAIPLIVAGTSPQDVVSSSLRTQQQRRLAGSFFTDSLVDSMETAYDEYATAWRMLGLYIDCGKDYMDSVPTATSRRQLAEEEGEDAEEEDAAANEENEEAVQEENNNYQCKRNLLWAAYVDLEYEGNGLREYSIYNPRTRKWDSTMCDDVKKCHKMDCHLPSTRYKLLGFFKEEYPVEFFGVLAKHQGTCTWNEEDQALIQEGLNWLPSGCTVSKTLTDDNKNTYVYFDLKPKLGGSFEVGLYTDAQCIVPYTEDKHTATSILNTYYGYDDAADTDTALSKLNTALDDFKVCQPCRTYDLTPAAENENAADDEEAQDGENADNADGEEAEDVDNNANAFVCKDNAGYEGVNMCYMFTKNTQMSKASFRDIEMASAQHSIVRTNGAADMAASWFQEWGFLLISGLIFLVGIVSFCSVAVKRKRTNRLVDKREPLIENN